MANVSGDIDLTDVISAVEETTSSVDEAVGLLREIRDALVKPSPDPDPPVPDPDPDPPAPVPTPSPVSGRWSHDPKRGVNLDFLQHYEAGCVFLRELDRISSGWKNFGNGPELLFFRDAEGLYPSGLYRVAWDGPGSLSASGDAVPLGSPPNELEFNVPRPSNTGFTLRSIGDVRNIRFLRAGGILVNDTFAPDFLDKVSAFSTVRFIGWQYAGESDLTNWQERPRVDNGLWTQWGRGVPFERIIELANTAMVNPWVHIPWQADDAFLTLMADLFAEELDDRLTLYVEYSNETWNTAQGFDCGKAVAAAAEKDPIRSPPEVAGDWANIALGSFRSHWERHADRERLKCVVASHRNRPWWSQQMLPRIDSQNVDMLSVAGYFKASKDVTHLDDLFSQCRQDIDEQVEFIRQHSQLAANQWLEFGLYECGQHLTTYGNKQRPQYELYMQAQQDPRMGEMYDYLQERLDGLPQFDLAVWYCLQRRITAGQGAFGLLSGYAGDGQDSPKWLSVVGAPVST